MATHSSTIAWKIPWTEEPDRLQSMRSQRDGHDRATSFHFHFSLSNCSISDGKESVCNAGDLGSIPGSGRSPGEGNGNPSSILAWRIPWTEEPDRLQFMGSQRVGHDRTTYTYFLTPYYLPQLKCCFKFP